LCRSVYCLCVNVCCHRVTTQLQLINILLLLLLYYIPGGVRTHDLSRRASVDLRRRPRGHWDRQCYKQYELLTIQNRLYFIAAYSITPIL
jgi:hypothetical protein